MRWARRVFSHYAFIGISRRHLRLLVAELRPGWPAGREGRLHSRRGRARRRAAGAGLRAMLRFTDRLVVTLVQLRLGMPHEAIAVASGVDRSTVTRAISQLRPLPAARGCATPAGIRSRTLADVFACAAAEGVTLRLDATEVRVRRPRAGRPGRKAFVSGKLKQNTIKTTIPADQHGAMLWCGSTRPGRMLDTTAARVEGIDALLAQYPRREAAGRCRHMQLTFVGARNIGKLRRSTVSSAPVEQRGDAWDRPCVSGFTPPRFCSVVRRRRCATRPRIRSVGRTPGLCSARAPSRGCVAVPGSLPRRSAASAAPGGPSR